VLPLNRTYATIKETRKLLEKIDASIKRVFEIYPSNDPSYIKRKKQYMLKKQGAPQKVVMVFIAANQDFYGDLIFEISRLFIADFQKTQADAVVIGKIGRVILSREKIESPRIKYFDLDDDRPDLRVVQEILEILEGYDKVLVYHGRTESLLRQIPIRSEVLREIPDLVKPAKKYIFEPTADEVLDFLQTQTSINSFHQRIYEAQYAKLAAKRWNWTKQQMARARLLEEMTHDFLKFKKSLLQKQQQVTIFAHRQDITGNPNIKNTNVYGR
ncbi:MAG TPA: F0F1 ATP synthase subunit gamma, partial [Patescibacteria group bacterium]|nr:F0F1 ATP synthase subunit gamma [Patescibacteria group bacterium]